MITRTRATALYLIGASLFWVAGLAVPASIAETSAPQNVPAPAAPIPIPQDDAEALAKAAHLPESQKPVMDLVPDWRKPKAILVALDRPEQLSWLQKVVPDVKLVIPPPGRRRGLDWSTIPNIGDVDGAIGIQPSEDLLRAAQNIRWFHMMGAGVENVVTEPDVASGKFLITDSPASIIPQVGDNAIAMMVALMRGLDLYDKMAATKHMTQPQFGERGWQIEGRTVLVVGLGGLGNQVAAMAYGLGMKVIATRETSHNGPYFVDYVGLANELPQLAPKADVVVVCTPLTSETKGLFNAQMFARMKKGAIFINIARGQEVVQSDLVAAVESGQLGGVGLEVTDPEPLPDGDPLWNAPNTIIMTHAGAPATPPAGIDTYRQKEWIIAREDLRRYANGEKMLDVIDVKRGY